LAALLPKLHLNHHTPHAVIFGNSRFGGLGLPDFYSWAHLADTQRRRYAWNEKLACSYKTAAILSSWSMTMMLFMAAVDSSAHKPFDVAPFWG
jgi:hypothetical protein